MWRAPAAVLAAARQGRITLFTSPVLLAELEDVLSREKFAERIGRVGSSVAQMLTAYRALVTIVRPAAIEPTVRDPDDDHVLACQRPRKLSLSFHATKTCFDLHKYQGIPILASADALQRLETN